MQFTEIKKFTLYEDGGENVSTTLNELIMNRNSSTEKSIDNKVIKYFKTKENNSTADIAKHFNLSKHVVDRIIDNYINECIKESSLKTDD